MCRTVNGSVRQRTHSPKGQEHGHHEAPVAYAIGNKCFLSRCCRTVACVPKRNEEVRTCSHAFPTEEGNEQVLAKYQHQHGEYEKVQINKELRKLRIAVHVTHGVQMNERADTCNEQCHRDRELIGKKCQVYLQ